MERENEDRSELIDLGAATAETRGPVGILTDEFLGREATGLSTE